MSTNKLTGEDACKHRPASFDSHYIGVLLIDGYIHRGSSDRKVFASALREGTLNSAQYK